MLNFNIVFNSCVWKILLHGCYSCYFIAFRNEKTKSRQREERTRTIRVDESMRDKKVFGYVKPNGRVVTRAQVLETYPKASEDDVNWALRVQVG